MKLFCVLILAIFVASCTKNTQSPNNVCAPVVCTAIMGRAADWDVISDELLRNIYRHNKMCEMLDDDIDKMQ